MKTPSQLANRAATLVDDLLQRAPALADARHDYPPVRLLSLFSIQDPYRGYRALPPDFVRACEELQRRLGPDGLSDYLHLILAHLINEFDSRFAASGLDETFLPGFESNMSRMLDRAHKSRGLRPSLSDDVFLKDFGIARLVLVPCVSHLIYRHSGVPRRSLLRQTPGSLMRAASYLAIHTRGVRPFLENHVHVQMLHEFNPVGRERCYRMVARLLQLWPESKGLIGASWYYDPALGRISANLAYLHDVPAAKGAIFLRIGAEPGSGALARSETRRRLHQAGKYRPTTYLMVWSRADILRHYSGSLGSA